MRLGRRRAMFLATGTVMVCLIGIMSVRVSAGQAGPAPAPLMTDTVFTNIQVLKGIPVDTFFDVMGMFASSMGEDCTFCHVKEAPLDRTKFAESTPRIMRARQMIAMMNTINGSFFGKQPRVTCFTCHRGTNSPVNAPRLSLQYSPPDDDPNVIDFPTYTGGATADQILDKYIQALGGAAQLAKVTSFTAKGTYSGFDTGHREVPVEFFAKAPNQRTWIIHMFDGDSRRIFDGKNGWFAGFDRPVPIETLTSGNLDRSRIEAVLAFPAGIKQAYNRWRVGRSAIDDLPVEIVQGTTAGLLPVNLYFDPKTSLLVRLVRWNQTVVGPVPTQIDYEDYRDVAGVKMPFSWTVSQTYMQMTVKLTEIKPNVPIDAKVFAAPTVAAR